MLLAGSCTPLPKADTKTSQTLQTQQQVYAGESTPTISSSSYAMIEKEITFIWICTFIYLLKGGEGYLNILLLSKRKL